MRLYKIVKHHIILVVQTQASNSDGFNIDISIEGKFKKKRQNIDEFSHLPTLPHEIFTRCGVATMEYLLLLQQELRRFKLNDKIFLNENWNCSDDFYDSLGSH